MPFKDHSGPNGEGPMTGRALGDCTDNKDVKTPIDESRLGLGRGAGRGRNIGRGRRPGGRGRRSQGRN